ncbi:hypothetical protein SAMN05421810_106130 [Amycolatopsis arida]|uniref:Uncharacterized protein n=1 Tax=Amycolatopsis arida TaxID=587909 RepID=A0A1I5XKL7_9PSEU|nr:hypothetical protein [Amycolatopsis arida]TDX97388.1 hypothetical protein CLV69_102491 [Amycolatopsis arida]SFQ32474.1 hypothetical protein SAMN05421810_106130 [Amycolatopsis arida]
MDTTHGLPPKPDPRTGEPRPPRAPLSGDHAEPRQPYRERKVLQPPAGEGPALEWHYGDRRMQRWMAGIIFGGLCIIATFKRGGLAWMAEWDIWVVFMGLAAVGYIVPLGHKISAGADWLNCRGGFVKTYELTEIKVTPGGGGDPHIELFDQHGGSADTGMNLIQANQALWDLVYNGIRHSVANGATTNRLARKWLRLDDPWPPRARSDRIGGPDT